MGIIFLLDAVSEKYFILARSVFVLHGHRLCRDIAVVLIASVTIWIPDILLYFYRETGNWRFTGSEIRSTPYHGGSRIVAVKFISRPHSAALAFVWWWLLLVVVEWLIILKRKIIVRGADLSDFFVDCRW